MLLLWASLFTTLFYLVLVLYFDINQNQPESSFRYQVQCNELGRKTNVVKNRLYGPNFRCLSLSLSMIKGCN